MTSNLVPKYDDLIIDVGMHEGEDTAFYLAKGFNVVSIEANPVLAEAAGHRFAEELASGRLRILAAAVSEHAGTTKLAVDRAVPLCSSTTQEFIQRNAASGARHQYVEVPAIRFRDVLREVGIPYYLKIDIEGADMLCVRPLHEFTERPTYLSLESDVTSARPSPDRVFDELAELWTLGYRAFKYVNQFLNSKQRPCNPPLEGKYVESAFTEDSSGPFGEESPGDWHTIAPTLRRAEILRLHHELSGWGGRWQQTLPSKVYRRLRRELRRPVPRYDLHARRDPVSE